MLIKNFERLLRGGAYFDVPEENQDWVLYDADFENPKELCRGGTLEEMIGRAPGSNMSIFEEIEVGQHFLYLDEHWIKTSEVGAERVGDGCKWRFKQSVEVIKQ